MIADFVADVKKQGGNQIIPLIVYDLPERDCSALASNGELSLDNDGEAKYKEYIAAIKKQIQAAGTAQKFVLVIGKLQSRIETDAADKSKHRTRFTCQPRHEYECSQMSESGRGIQKTHRLGD
jgi:hypothetical protein